jgi:hypothetical protein
MKACQLSVTALSGGRQRHPAAKKQLEHRLATQVFPPPRVGANLTTRNESPKEIIKASSPVAANALTSVAHRVKNEAP